MLGLGLRAAVLVVVVATAGCLSGFSEVLPTPDVSTLAFACAVLLPSEVDEVILASYAEAGTTLDPGLALTALANQTAALSGRPASAVRMTSHSLPAAAEPGWNTSQLATWARDMPFLGRNHVTLRIAWVLQLDHHDAMGAVVAPGAIALSEVAIEAAALHLNQTLPDVTRAALLHFAGHAFGVTNRGIPVQDPALQVREGTPGHDADPASVLAAGWEDARAAAWAANATYDRYPDAALADWRAARGPDGVCS